MPHIVALLTKGVPVVLDFPANTRRQRAWFRQLIEMSGSDHELHFIVASDELCKRQLKQRSEELGLPPGAKWTTEADIEEFTAYFGASGQAWRFQRVQFPHRQGERAAPPGIEPWTHGGNKMS